MTYPFVPARGFTPTSGRDIDLIVVHTIEAPETERSAEGCARYFQTTDRQVSAHYCIDNDSIVQCVHEKDVAWCAPGANHDGIHLEHAGFARQSPQDWRDPFSRAMLERSAQLAADIAVRYRIPVTWLSPLALIHGRRGFTSHNNVSIAFKRSNHWDPGPGFPQERYLAEVARHVPQRPPVEATPLVTREEWTWRRWWLGEGEFRDFGPHDTDVRPAFIRERIPPEWWQRLEEFIAARKAA